MFTILMQCATYGEVSEFERVEEIEIQGCM